MQQIICYSVFFYLRRVPLDLTEYYSVKKTVLQSEDKVL